MGHDPAMGIEQRLDELGLRLPVSPRLPAGHVATFSWVRVVGDRVLVSGHGPQEPDGSPAGPFGRVPDEITFEQAQASARRAALSVIGSVRHAVGDLDRVAAWVTVSGFVQAEPGYPETTGVINAFSELVIQVFGETVGQHARTAIGAAALPLNLPVVVAAELSLRPSP
jgi:enamine deaminase RidA (YjgF/YER057c/UK114 family)